MHIGDGAVVETPLEMLQRLARETGVWNHKGGLVKWASEDLKDACWNRKRDELYIVWESTSNPHESGLMFERRSWPKASLLGTCELDCPGGFDTLVASPTEDLAAFSWLWEEEAGIELIQLPGLQPSQVQGAGYKTTVLISAPVFSSDGQWLAASIGSEGWWSDTFAKPSPGGVFPAGRVMIYNLKTRKSKEVELTVSVPPGWIPNEPESILAGIIGAREFSDSSKIHITLPTGAKAEVKLPADPSRAISIAKVIAHHLMSNLAEESCNDPRFQRFKLEGKSPLAGTLFDIHLPAENASSQEMAQTILARSVEAGSGVVALAPARYSKACAKEVQEQVEASLAAFPTARGKRFVVVGEGGMEIYTIGKAASWLKKLFG